MMILGIDFGSSHIGLALGDSETKISFPYKSLHNFSTDSAEKELLKIIADENVQQVVVGLPVATHTTLTNFESSKEAAQNFADKLAKSITIPVTMIDERFTTKQAKKMQDSDVVADDHALSAMLILQMYFDLQVS